MHRLICLLDDDLSVLKANARLLASAGWESEQFHEPEQFLNFAQREQPRLAIIDCLMPTMSGLEVQTRLKQISPGTRLIILTSRDDATVRGTASANGVAAFFAKPVEPALLITTIKRLLAP